MPKRVFRRWKRDRFSFSFLISETEIIGLARLKFYFLGFGVASHDPNHPEHLCGGNALSWIHQHARVSLPEDVPAEVLRFSRYSSTNDAVVLVPDTYANFFEKVLFVREPKQTVISTESYRPAKRVASAKPSRRDFLGLVAERFTCREVTLRCTPTRSSHWGMDLDRLPLGGGEPCLSLETFLHGFGFLTQTASGDTLALLNGAYAVAAAEKLDKKRLFRAPKLPLIHNQRDGIRYTLYLDDQNIGSPSPIHVLLYPEGQKPTLVGWAATERPSATERKPGLLLLATPDKRIRFYQATDDQWQEWQRQRPSLDSIPENLRPVVAEAIAAAERLRQTIS